MNDYDNNIILASQAGCDLVLITEEGGDFPVGSKVFYYKDTDGNAQGFDTTNATNGYNLFKDNQNIAVDWEVDMPRLLIGDYMFSGSNIKTVSINSSFPVSWEATGSNIKNLFENCKELETVKMPIYTFYTTPSLGILGADASSYFKDCTKLKNVHLWRLL